MVWVDGRCRVDLQAVVAFAGILEQTVHGVQHLVGQQEEPFSAVKERKRYRNSKKGEICTWLITVYISKRHVCNNYIDMYAVLLPG